MDPVVPASTPDSAFAELGDPLDLPYAEGRPVARGRIRVQPEDFEVVEILGFEPDGQGEHAFLRLRKRGANTEWVARRLAAFAGVRPRDVGYAGLKDRLAVTEQWFSVCLPGRSDPDWSALGEPGIEVLEAVRNGRKLRRGALVGNRFRLEIRDLAEGGPPDRAVFGEGSSLDRPGTSSDDRVMRAVADRAALEGRLRRVAERGVPNYFGPQRFGIRGGNLAKAQAVFQDRRRERDRHKRGLYYSAVRSALFNRVLAARVEAGLWDRGLAGDAMMLEGSRSFFVAEELDATIRARLAALDIHPSGPLWGRGAPATRGEARAFEEAVLAPCAAWCAGLEAEGLDQGRRSLRLRVADLAWDWPAPDRLVLRFRLPPGAYATTLLREVLLAEEATAAEGEEPGLELD